MENGVYTLYGLEIDLPITRTETAAAAAAAAAGAEKIDGAVARRVLTENDRTGDESTTWRFYFVLRRSQSKRIFFNISLFQVRPAFRNQE